MGIIIGVVVGAASAVGAGVVLEGGQRIKGIATTLNPFSKTGKVGKTVGKAKKLGSDAFAVTPLGLVATKKGRKNVRKATKATKKLAGKTKRKLKRKVANRRSIVRRKRTSRRQKRANGKKRMLKSIRQRVPKRARRSFNADQKAASARRRAAKISAARGTQRRKVR